MLKVQKRNPSLIHQDGFFAQTHLDSGAGWYRTKNEHKRSWPVMVRPVFDLAALRRHLARLEQPRGGDAATLGDPILDAAFPRGGLPRCGLHDVLGPEADAAASGFAFALAARLAGGSRRILHICPRQRRQAAGLPYGPGLVRLGIDPDRLILAVASRRIDVLWAMEESLRSSVLAVVMGEGVNLDLTSSRRLQLAAEKGHTAALLLSAEARSSVALTRWRVESAPSPDGPYRPRWRVTLERCRGGSPGDWIVDWDDEAHRFSVVPPLANRRAALAIA